MVDDGAGRPGYFCRPRCRFVIGAKPSRPAARKAIDARGHFEASDESAHESAERKSAARQSIESCAEPKWKPPGSYNHRPGTYE